MEAARSPPLKQRKALQPGQVTAPEVADGHEVKRDDEKRATLEGVELGEGEWRS